MPEFVKPFPGMEPDRKLSKDELVRALRLDLAAEEEATHLYTAHADACKDPVVRAALRNIAREEIVHAGEFMQLIERLNPDETTLFTGGQAEARWKGEAVELYSHPGMTVSEAYKVVKQEYDVTREEFNKYWQEISRD
jgi:rubrerythrin